VDDRIRYVAGGAALGAIAGALVGVIVARSHGGQLREEGQRGVPARHGDADGRSILRLGMSVIAVVRQILELA
jgi:gas vesicle protein